MLTFQFEKIDEALAAGASEMIWAHWEEADTDREEVPLSPDWPHYRRLEKAGGYRVVTARQDGRMVGYSTFFLNRHTRAMMTIMAVSDVLYLAPEARRGWNGVRLLREADRLLKRGGAVRVTYGINTTVRIGARGATVGDLLARLGYTKVGEIYSRLL